MPPTAETLLDQCYELGNRILGALREEDWTSAAAWVVRRQEIIDTLRQHIPPHTLPRTPEIVRRVERLRNQDRDITQISASIRHQWEMDLSRFRSYEQAHRHYQQEPPRRQLLHPELRG